MEGGEKQPDRSTRLLVLSGGFRSGRVVAWMRVCRVDMVVYPGVSILRCGRCPARRDAFVLARACRAPCVNVGTLGNKRNQPGHRER